MIGSRLTSVLKELRGNMVPSCPKLLCMRNIAEKRRSAKLIKQNMATPTRPKCLPSDCQAQLGAKAAELVHSLASVNRGYVDTSAGKNHSKDK